LEFDDVHAKTNSIGQETKRLRARLVLLGLFALFFLPVISAVFIAAKAPHWTPFGSINYGELVQPPVADALRDMKPLDGGAEYSSGLSAPWVIAHVGHAECVQQCEIALAQMRQARLALGKDAHRVQRWWLVLESPEPATVVAIQQAHPGLRIGLLDAHSPMAATSLQSTSVQMIDPAGFLILRYSTLAPSAAQGTSQFNDLPRALLKDFKRLLRISREGA
jgi:hypothetical protein